LLLKARIKTAIIRDAELLLLGFNLIGYVEA